MRANYSMQKDFFLIYKNKIIIQQRAENGIKCNIIHSIYFKINSLYNFFIHYFAKIYKNISDILL